MNEAGKSEESKPKETIVLPPVDPKIIALAHSRTVLGLERIGGLHLEKLRQAGIRSLKSLLERAATPKARRQIAKEVGTSERNVLGWVLRADIQRVPGVGPQYAGLLESAGVDTVPELARRNPENLHSKILEVNASRMMVRKPPARKQVEKWVLKAKQLPRVVEY